LSEDIQEEEGLEEEPIEYVVMIPVIESGSYLYVCEQCGSDLIEIPYYNRYYCPSCGLHY
jgi:rubrerythrin